jgi:hypothetical protein
MYPHAEYLFYRIVQKANSSEFSPWRLEEFIEARKFKIQRVGTVLQFLGLAERTENGWAATYRLMDIIAEQLTRRPYENGKLKVTDCDREFLHSLYGFATGVHVDDWDYEDAIDDNLFFMKLIFEFSTGINLVHYDYDSNIEDDERFAAAWCWNVLAALGLIRGNGKRFEFKPTPRLKRLFESALEERREELWGRSSKELSAQSSNILYLSGARDPQVSEKSLTISAVPPRPDGSPPPRVASANSIEGATATSGSSADTLRARDLGKPVLGVLRRRSAIPVQFYPKWTGAKSAPFSSVAAERSDKKGGRLATPALRGQPAKVSPRPEKLSAKLPKLGNRKAQAKKAKRASGNDPSDWW